MCLTIVLAEKCKEMMERILNSQDRGHCHHAGLFLTQVQELDEGLVEQGRQMIELGDALLDVAQDFSKTDSMVKARLAAIAAKFDPWSGCRPNKPAASDK